MSSLSSSLLLLQIIICLLTYLMTPVDAGRCSPQASPAERQASLLIRMHQTFDMFRHLASMCDQQLRDARNRNEQDLLNVGKEGVDKQDYSVIIDGFTRLADSFSTTVERMVDERQKSSHRLTLAFERHVDKSLPYSRDSADTRQAVTQIRDLWTHSNERLNDLVAKSRAQIKATTTESVDDGQKLIDKCGDGPSWPKKLNRQAAELVVKLHELSDRNLGEGVRLLKDFETSYSDLVKLMLTYEKNAHSESLLSQK